ncbi:MAG: lysophospholipase [Spirochaetaceae bacterium]|jgi:alpha-beta hydrolase superfamily lysophospholipase|nr:lysophospholipase [Spirochaetaceae bacterium]
MFEQTSWLETHDKVRLFLRRWESRTSGQGGRGVVHIIHGMSEHSLRFEETAHYLCEKGYTVWAADMRGHGRTADASINPPDNGGLLGHCADTNAFSKLLLDVERINMEIQKAYPELPLFLLGHSWGALIAQGYIETFNKRPLAGCALSGTKGPDRGLTAFASPFITVFTALRSVRGYFPFTQKAVFDAYNKMFQPNRTEFDWLSRDEAEVDAFVADPLCGCQYSAGFYRDTINALRRVHRRRTMERVNRELPLYVFSGSADPAGNMGECPTALVDIYRKIGIHDIEFVLYPEARHETLHETNRQEVMRNLCDWLDRHLKDAEKCRRTA